MILTVFGFFLRVECLPKFSAQTETHIEIDGLYSTFDHISLRDLTSQRQHTDEASLGWVRKGIVTDPSCISELKPRHKANLTDIRWSMKMVKVSRYILKLCKPLSWTVEAAGPAIGGFYEKVDLLFRKLQFLNLFIKSFLLVGACTSQKN